MQPTIHPFLTQISEYVLRSDQQDRSGPYSYTIHIETRLVQCRSNLSTGRVALRRDPYAANFGPIIIPRPEMPQRFSRIPVRRPKTPMPQTLVRNPAARNGPKILPHTPQNPYAANFGPKSRGPKCPKDSPACGAPKLLCRKHSPACGGSRNPYAANFGPKPPYAWIFWGVPPTPGGGACHRKGGPLRAKVCGLNPYGVERYLRSMQLTAYDGSFASK